jgi:hypothetical protein|tara:strand:- start:3237 stop:3590 length:354 start_codon:yes stop_codon:yes gene_type:complete
MDLLLIALPEDTKDVIKSYIGIKINKSLYFLNKKYYENSYNIIFKIINYKCKVDTYIRKLLRNDLDFFLLHYLNNVKTDHLFKKKIVYKKIKMNYSDYLKKLIIDYDSIKCKKLINM